jgi:hypothetical protein
MTLYVLTHSADYYPCGGTDDWLGVFTDEAEAWQAYDKIEPGAYSTAYLIEVRPDGYRELGSAWRSWANPRARP